MVDLNGEKIHYFFIEFLDFKYFVNQHCLVTNEVKPMFGLMLALDAIYLIFGLITWMMSRMFSNNICQSSKQCIVLLARWEGWGLGESYPWLHTLDLQCSFKKMTMVINNEFVLKKRLFVSILSFNCGWRSTLFHLQAQVFGIHKVDEENMCSSPKVCEKWTMF